MSGEELSLGTQILAEAAALIARRNYTAARELLYQAPDAIRASDPEVNNTITVCCIHLQKNREGLRLAEAVALAALSSGNEQLWRQATLRKSIFLWRMGRVSRSEACLRDCMKGVSWRATTKLVATANNSLATIYAVRGDWERAEPHFIRALLQFQKLGEAQGVASANHNLGVIHTHRGEFGIAQKYFQSAADYYLSRGTPHEVIFSEAERSLAVAGVGDQKRAEAMARLALERCKSSKTPALMAEVLRILGTILRLNGCYDESEGVLRKGLEVAARIQNPQIEADIQEQLGRLYFAEGNPTRAHAHLSAAARYYRRIDASWFLARLQELSSGSAAA